MLRSCKQILVGYKQREEERAKNNFKCQQRVPPLCIVWIEAIVI